jgi:hypothetical protein
MAITRRIKPFLVQGFAAALALGAASCSTYPAAPAQPAFDTDVLPIFQAHCTRCHDNNPDGGPRHSVYRPDSEGGPVTATNPGLSVYGPCYASGSCYTNAAAFAVKQDGQPGLIYQTIHRAVNDTLLMPPPPSRRLNEFELNVIDNWLAETPMPICSHSANPDPALLCP